MRAGAAWRPDATDRCTVRACSSTAAAAALQVDRAPAPDAGRVVPRRQRRLHLVGTAGGVRPLAHDRRAAQSPGSGGSLSARGERVAAPQVSCSLSGQHERQAGCGSRRRSANGRREAIGRSRGGLSSKLHALVADERTALITGLTPGQSGEVAERLGNRPAQLVAGEAKDRERGEVSERLGISPLCPLDE